MPSFYRRRINIEVTPSEGPSPFGLKFGNDLVKDGQELRMSFEVHQSISIEENKAKVQIHNLGDASRGLLSGLKRPDFTISAGYAGELLSDVGLGLLFSGTALRIISSRTPTGFVTLIDASDGHQAKAITVNKALAPGATVLQAVQLIAAELKLSTAKALDAITSGKLANAPKYLQGINLTGSAAKLLSNLAKENKFDISIQDGELEITEPTTTTSEVATLLAADSGLIGSPERFYDHKLPGKLMVKAKSLINANIKPHRRVRLDSKDFRGDYKVLRVAHTGDNWDQAYYSEAELMEVPHV